MSAKTEVLNIWTVYDHPADFPTQWVARRFELDKATNDVLTFDSFPELREHFENQRHLFWMPRQEGDEPHIAGTFF